MKNTKNLKFSETLKFPSGMFSGHLIPSRSSQLFICNQNRLNKVKAVYTEKSLCVYM